MILQLLNEFLRHVFVQPIDINEGRLNDRNTSLYNAAQFDSTTNSNLKNNHNHETERLLKSFDKNWIL